MARFPKRLECGILNNFYVYWAANVFFYIESTRNFSGISFRFFFINIYPLILVAAAAVASVTVAAVVAAVVHNFGGQIVTMQRYCVYIRRNNTQKASRARTQTQTKQLIRIKIKLSSISNSRTSRTRIVPQKKIVVL